MYGEYLQILSSLTLQLSDNAKTRLREAVFCLFYFSPARRRITVCTYQYKGGGGGFMNLLLAVLLYHPSLRFLYGDDAPL